MKSLKDYSLNLSEKDYHLYPAWSYSLIARYAREGFDALSTLHKQKEPTAAMEFGSLFDSILTRGKKTLDYYSISNFVPTDAVKQVLDTLLVCTSVPFDEIPQNVIENATIACSYYPKWGYDAKYGKLAEAKAYYDARREGKKVVSEDDWNDAMEMARTIHLDEYLSGLFGTKNTSEVEYIYQAQFLTKLWTPKGRLVEVKVMPDLLVVNHKNKTVQPVDLKTSSMPAYDFAEQFIKMRYDIQAYVYTDVVRAIMNEDPDYADYTILPYLFTDISRVDKVPVTYEYDPNSESQINGLAFGQYQYKHWKDVLDEIIDYEEAEAKVPDYITTEGPNDLLDILNSKR